MKCTVCEIEFSPSDKLQRAKREQRPAGKHTQCIDCAEEDKEPVYTGVMISGTKTASAIQINKDPALTRYMLKSSPSSGSRVAMVTTAPKQKSGQVHVFVTEIAKRRE